MKHILRRKSRTDFVGYKTPIFILVILLKLLKFVASNNDTKGTNNNSRISDSLNDKMTQQSQFDIQGKIHLTSFDINVDILTKI